jgi:hypothetical protein
MAISLRDEGPLSWPSREDHSARLSLPSKQKGGDSNPSGRAELLFYLRKRGGGMVRAAVAAFQAAAHPTPAGRSRLLTCSRGTVIGGTGLGRWQTWSRHHAVPPC